MLSYISSLCSCFWLTTLSQACSMSCSSADLAVWPFLFWSWGWPWSWERQNGSWWTWAQWIHSILQPSRPSLRAEFARNRGWARSQHWGSHAASLAGQWTTRDVERPQHPHRWKQSTSLCFSCLAPSWSSPRALTRSSYRLACKAFFMIQDLNYDLPCLISMTPNSEWLHFWFSYIQSFSVLLNRSFSVYLWWSSASCDSAWA